MSGRGSVRAAAFRVAYASALAGTLAAAALGALWTLYVRPLPFLVGGIQVNEPDNEAWLDALESNGLNTVALTVYATQKDWDGDTLVPETEDEARGVVEEIRAARARGLRTVLVLRVKLDHACPRNRFLWHGLILPRDETTRRSWFAAYGRFVERWAALAEREGVDVLGIGSELTALTSTRPVEAIPPLAAYYLDETAQAERRRAVLAAADRLRAHHLWAGYGATFERLEDYLDAQTAAWRAWARRAAWQDDPRPVERIVDERRRLEEHWRRLVARVRALYGGRITYAANFDQYREVGFWDVLDLIGVNAYFHLRPPGGEPDPPDGLFAVLEERWSAILDEMASFRREENLVDRPYLFTEIGYTRRKGTTRAPWAGGGFDVLGGRVVVWDEEPVAPAERRRALEALRSAWDRRRRARRPVAPGREEEAPLLAGLLYWKLSTQKAHEAIEPFVILVGEDGPDAAALRAFAEAAGAPALGRVLRSWLGRLLVGRRPHRAGAASLVAPSAS